jgi:chromosome segregation protein
VDGRATEIYDLKAEIDRLTDQLAQGDSATAELKDGWRREIDRNRAEHQAQLAALGGEFQLKQQNLENSLAEERQRIAEYQRQVDLSGQRHVNLETELEKGRRELEVAATETMELRSRLEDLQRQRQTDLAAVAQQSEQARLALDAELTAARHELQEKAWAAAQQQAALENLALAHKSQIQTLEAKIAYEQQSIKERDVALERSRSQARLLEQRVEEMAAERQQAELTAVNRAVQIKEEYGVRIADLERQLARKASELLERGTAQSEHESTLRREIDRLVHESGEKNQILQNRNEELVRVKADLDMLQEQHRALESAATQNEAAISADSERMRSEFQAQLALLQAELSQKEWAIEERQALLHGLEQNYRQEIDSLRQRIAELEEKGAEEKHDFVLGDPVPSQDKLEGTRANGDEPFASDHQRRWHTGFGWKRRWKTSEA